MEKIGQKIRRIRKAKGMTLKQVAEQTSFSYQALGQYERSERNVSWTHAVEIATALGLRPSELLHNTEEHDALHAELADSIRRFAQSEENVLYPKVSLDPIFIIEHPEEIHGEYELVEQIKTWVDNIRKACIPIYGVHVGNLVLRFLSAYSKLNLDGRKRIQEMIEDFATIPKYMEVEEDGPEEQ